MNILLNFYGIEVLVSVKVPSFNEIIYYIKEDLGYFISTGQATNLSNPNITIVIEGSESPSHQVSLFKFFKTKTCQVYGWGRKRLCDYGNGTTVTSTMALQTRTFVVRGQVSRMAEVYEATYLALLSSVGEELDMKGFHRVHALGIRYKHN